MITEFSQELTLVNSYKVKYGPMSHLIPEKAIKQQLVKYYYLRVLFKYAFCSSN